MEASGRLVMRSLSTPAPLAAAVAALVLAGCATSPAPIYGPGRTAAPPPRAGLPPPQTYGAAPEILRDRAPLQCVPYARERSGISIYGDAHTWWTQAQGRFPRSSYPAPGSVLVMRGYNTDARGHVAYVAAMISDREILVDHANWMNGGEVSVRVPVLDVSPSNDWSEVRVWHVPGGHWGGRVYQVQGFIHPLPMTVARR
jgi:hypothetical protein